MADNWQMIDFVTGSFTLGLGIWLLAGMLGAVELAIPSSTLGKVLLGAAGISSIYTGGFLADLKNTMKKAGFKV